MSYQVGTSCNLDAASAARAAITAENGRQFVIGTKTYVYQIDGIYAGGSAEYAWIDASYYPKPTGTKINASYSFKAEPCGLLDTVDGVVIAWAIAAAWIAVYSIAFLRKGIHE